MATRILILGGYGNTGFLIARLLVKESSVELVIAGRDINRAEQTATELNSEFYTDRVSFKYVDASNTNSLKTAFAGVNLVVVASSTIEYTYNVVSVALEVGIDYLDVQLSSPTKLSVLNSFRKELERQGRCFITDSGFHPGVPAAMVRYAATKIDVLEVANISAAFQLKWKELLFSESTTSEFIDELMNFNPMVLKNRKWIDMGMKEIPKFNFGELFGERYCLPMYLEELQSLPDLIPSLNETGFYISGFNWMVDYIIIPIAFATYKVFQTRAKSPMGHLLKWGLRNFSKPPFGAVIQLQAKGMKGRQNRQLLMRLTHDDAYVLTAVPSVACLLQYLDGSIRQPGLWFQANLVAPQPFFDDIERLGVRVSIQVAEASNLSGRSKSI